MRKLAGFLAILGLALFGYLGLATPPAAQQSSPSDQSTLAKLISSLLSTPASTVRIGRIDGALSSDAAIFDLEISDRDGVWLKLDRARMIWSRTALFSGRLQVDRLEVGKLDVLRRPVPSGEKPDADEPLLPELPVKVVVTAFELADLALAEPVVGVAARWKAAGRTELGDPSEGLDLDFSAQRLDRQGEAGLKLVFVPKTTELSLSLKAREDAGGMAVRLANVPDLPPLSVDFSGSGKLDDWNGRLALTAGPGLSAEGNATIRKEAAARRLAFQFDARVASLMPANLRKIFGETGRIDGDVVFADDGAITANRLGLSAPDAGVAYAGTLKGRQLNGLLAAEMRGLQRIDPRLTGRLRIDGKTIGPVTAPRISGVAQLIDATLAGRPVKKLAIALADFDPAQPLDVRISLDGDIDNRPAKGALRIARQADGFLLDGLDVAIGSAKLGGRVAVSDKTLAEGRVTLNAPDLSQLSALALGAMSGAAEATIELDHSGGAQNARIVARAGRLSAPGLDIRNLDIDARATNVLARPLIDGRMNIDRASAGAELIENIRIAARGEAQASAFTVKGRVRGFAIDAAGKATAGSDYRVDLASLTASRASQRIALAGPASVRISNGTAELTNVAVTVGSGRITAQGRVGKNLDLTVAARALPLSAVELVAPGTGLSGTLDGEAKLSGSPTAPTGSYSAILRGVGLPETREAGLPAIDARASGALDGKRASLDAQVTLGAAGTLRINGHAPLDPSAALDLAIRGTLDAALANRSLGASGRSLSGRATVDAKLTGKASAPAYGGTVSLDGGTFADPANGIRLSNIAAHATAQGKTLIVDRFVANTRNGGTLSVAGRVALEPQAGFPAQLRLTGARAELVNSPVVAMVADLGIDVSGPLARQPTVSGLVNIVSMDVNIPEKFDTQLRPLAKVKHIGASKALERQLAAERKQAARRKAQAPFAANLSLQVKATNRIFVRGRGVDAELEGELRLGGTSSAPVANGAFDLRRGRLVLLTQRLDFKSGRMTFAGGLIPELDFRAETQADSVTAAVTVTGPATAPVFEITSQPDLPRDEVLARLLFQKPSGSLSPVQALQIATAVAHLSGLGADADIIEKTRRALGVDTIDVQAGPGGPTVGASRYITRNVSVGVKAGANPAQSAVTVDIDVTRRVRIQGEVGADGRTSVGAGVQWEW